MELFLLGGLLTISFSLLRRLPLSLANRVGGSMVMSYIGSSLIFTVVSTIDSYPWLLLVLPLLVGGMAVGGLIVWKRYGPKDENPFNPF